MSSSSFNQPPRGSHQAVTWIVVGIIVVGITAWRVSDYFIALREWNSYLNALQKQDKTDTDAATRVNQFIGRRGWRKKDQPTLQELFDELNQGKPLPARGDGFDSLEYVDPMTRGHATIHIDAGTAAGAVAHHELNRGLKRPDQKLASLLSSFILSIVAYLVMLGLYVTWLEYFNNGTRRQSIAGAWRAFAAGVIASLLGWMGSKMWPHWYPFEEVSIYGWGIIVAAPSVLLVLISYAKRSDDPTPRCSECGYDLTRNESGRCPECGVAMNLRPSVNMR